ncbi:formylglycine-generating enzyme family protein [bacterium]|nr:formylglycine-generating enzyme family protein [bacterium]
MKRAIKMSLLGLLVMGLLASCQKEKAVNMEMVYVEGGEFEMGATSEQGNGAEDDEKPVRTVKLDSYYIGKYEVTQAQWKEVMGTNPSYFKGDNRPVENVSWEDAQEFCKRLSERNGKKYVLPTEAQWEYAARGGNKSQHYKYAGGNDIDEVAWYYDNSYGLGAEHPDYGTHSVGTKKANELGIYDMSGNVWEWCSDWYASSYDENDTENPQGPTSGSARVAGRPLEQPRRLLPRVEPEQRYSRLSLLHILASAWPAAQEV